MVIVVTQVRLTFSLTHLLINGYHTRSSIGYLNTLSATLDYTV